MALPYPASRLGGPSCLGYKPTIQEIIHPFPSDPVQSLGASLASRSKIDRPKVPISDQIVNGSE